MAQTQKTRSSTPKGGRYTIPNLQKAFEVLEVLSDFNGATFPRLLENIQCNKTSLFRILCTLEEAGYLRKNPETDAYCVSRKILKIANSALCEPNIAKESMDVLRSLRDGTSETVMLGVPLGGECVMIAQEPGLYSFNFTGRLGMTSPMHASAPGKALLAALPQCERRQAVASLTLGRFAANTITDAGALLEELDGISARGYATDSSEAVDGVNCVAAAVFGETGRPAATIWITGPAGRIAPSEFGRIGAMLVKSAGEISSRLGFRGSPL